jgi:DNA-binding SARP family transcriptional activator
MAARTIVTTGYGRVSSGERLLEYRGAHGGSLGLRSTGPEARRHLEGASVSTGSSSREASVDARTDTPRVALRLLGHFELRVDGIVVVLPTGPQRLAAYLALRGITARGRVAGELWPETTQGRAMGCLRTAIWRVNQATRGLIDAYGGGLDLDPRANVDVRQVLLTSGSLLTASTTPAIRTLPPAVNLLPTWEEHWLVHDRERVRQLQLHVIEAGADRLRATGEFGLALEWALAAVSADPFRESAHRSVISIHVAEGNIAEARRAYEACADLFRRELGVRPSALTSNLLLGAVRDAAVTVR